MGVSQIFHLSMAISSRLDHVKILQPKSEE